MRIQYEEIEGIINKGLVYLGCNKECALSISHSLLLAEMAGVTSHGINMLFQHIKKIKFGNYNLNPRFIIETETASFTKIDCQNAIGMYSAEICMNTAIKQAKLSGLHVVFAHHCNTYSAAFVYTLQAAKQGFIALTMSNSPAQMAPINGKSKLLGTNPFSFAIPARSENPILFDMATSVVAKSKINQAKDLNIKIPLGWALNEKGEPTTDPIEAVKGFILPMAGAKGYGLTIMIDVLAGVLSGAQFLDGVGRFYSSDQSCMNVGQIFIAINPKLLYGNNFYDVMDKYINKIRKSDTIGNEKIRIPGDNKFEKIDNAMKDGIVVSDSFISNFEELVYGD